MLIKKDFKRVAKILKEHLYKINGEYSQDRENITNKFIEWFKSEFPKFDKDKFKEAILKER